MREIPPSVKNCLKRHEKLRGFYGEIYFTSKWRLICHCNFCAESFDTILAYKKHVTTKHDNKLNIGEDDYEEIAEEEEIAETSSEKEIKPTESCNNGKDPLEENESETIQPMVAMKIEQLADENENIKKESSNTIQILEFSMKEEILTKQISKRIFNCNECNQSYEDKKLFINHRRSHSKRLKHSCTICPKKFAQDNDFKMHILWHSGGRPYICSWCGKDYRTVRALHIHERLHTNTRPYKCPYCERDFYKNRHLKEHVVTHTRERNHMCHICNSSFPRRKALKSHMKIHENKREHICNICDAAYNQRPALYFHMKNKHNVLPLTTSITSTEKNKNMSEVQNNMN